MRRVITYGTFDLLHYGHKRLLERAKQLGDYLIVGVTSDDFDRRRGKINTHQSLMERIAAVRALEIADEIIVEEYDGQKIDDIKRYDIDIFTVGSDWEGKFDYLKEYCKVIYLPRTEGVSSSEIRAEKTDIRIGIVGKSGVAKKFANECSYVIEGRHVICESPIAITEKECIELQELAKEKKLVLMDGIKSAYATAYSRLLLLIKSGTIGEVISVDSTCTSLEDEQYRKGGYAGMWSTICAWGPTALLPIFQILGTDYVDKHIFSTYIDEEKKYDGFTKIDFAYPQAVASIKIAKAAKSEGSLVITGTEGYIYVPSPWWKTDYFEVRYEDAENNKRYFYQLDGEGIRYEIVAFIKSIETGKDFGYISEQVTREIVKTIEACISQSCLK